MQLPMALHLAGFGHLAQGVNFDIGFFAMIFSYLYFAVFLAILSGCCTNCLPLFIPFRFAAVVAAYSAEDNALIAASGKYLSPVLEDRLPDFVRHFWAVQSFRDFWGAFTTYSPHQHPCTFSPEAEPYGPTTVQPPYLVPPPP